MNENNRGALRAMDVIVQAVYEHLMELQDEIKDESVQLDVCTVAAFLMTAHSSMRRILQENEEDET